MSPGVAFALGIGAGAVGVTLLYVSLAPALAERATYEAVTAGGSELPLPVSFVQGIAGPLSRRVRRIVAGKVAPWVT